VEKGKRPAGIKAVAARAGVSVGTVSNVLNRPDQVSEATRERVAAAIADVGFVRNSAAGALRVGRSAALGLVVLDLGNPFFTEVARGVEQVATEQGLTLLHTSSDEDPARQEAHLRFLEEHRVAGVLLSPVSARSPQVTLLRDRGTPVVLLDAPARRGMCSVTVDHHRGGVLAGEHLVATGRRRIAWVTGPPGIRQTAERAQGLAEAAGGSARVCEVALPALRGDAAHAAVDEVLATRPDAVLCANDVVALGVLRGLLERGIRVPKDVALVGYDDIEFAATAAVPLTSVRQPALEIGRAAAELLVEEIEGTSGHRHRVVRFAPGLVVRASSLQPA
jgi:LacI family transcriptional regulator